MLRFVPDAVYPLMACMFFLASPVQAVPVVFSDDFDRPDGAIGNGWGVVTQGTLGMEIVSGKVQNNEPTIGSSGMHRTLSLVDTLRLEADITQGSGSGNGNRFEFSFMTNNDGLNLGNTGYGVIVQRTNALSSDSDIRLTQNNVILETINSPFQYVDELHLDMTFDIDGSVVGTITEGTDVFNFNFAARTISASGSNVMMTYNIDNVTLRQTVDNVILTTDDGVSPPPVPEPTSALILGLLLIISRTGHRRRVR